LDEVLDGGDAVCADSMIRAVPVSTRGWRRLVAVAEQLSLRFQ
jgi:hypothetical protein